jgi:hypothetical protein
MDIFTKYDSKTWNKNVGYPCIQILEPGEFESLYSGRNPYEYFEEFGIEHFQHCHIGIWNSESSFVDLGTIAQIGNDNLPVLNIEFSVGRK